MQAFQARPAASAAALLALLGTAEAAQAAVTAQEVWDDWKANMAVGAEGGVTVGSEEAGDGTVTVTDFAYQSTGEDGTVVSFTIPEITFAEAGDGSVDVTVSEESPLTISSPGDAATGSPASEVALTMRQTGLDISVSGEAGALTYDYSAPRYAIELDTVTSDGAAVPAEAMIALNDVAGSSTSATADLRSMGQEFTAASLDLLVDVTNPDDGSHVSVSGQLQDLAFNGTAEMPLDAADNPEMVLMNGLAVAGGYTTGPGQYIFEFTDASGPTNGTVTSGGGEANFSLDASALGYDSSSTGLAIQATSAQMPFPINVSLAEYGLNLLMPAQKSDTPQDWALGVNLSDLSVNEEIWSMVDPQAMLSHDPATLIVDLTGTAKLFFDLFDPSQQEAMNAAAVPGEIDSVSINDLNVAIGGAQVTGSGAFTLDNADTTTFPGMPKPTGAVDLQMKGVNGLIDDLVAMGLLPQEQVMGARMFLGVLAVPVAGEEDSLTSHIEVTADGQLLANGQRLQ